MAKLDADYDKIKAGNVRTTSLSKYGSTTITWIKRYDIFDEDHLYGLEGLGRHLYYENPQNEPVVEDGEAVIRPVAVIPSNVRQIVGYGKDYDYAGDEDNGDEDDGDEEQAELKPPEKKYVVAILRVAIYILANTVESDDKKRRRAQVEVELHKFFLGPVTRYMPKASSPLWKKLVKKAEALKQKWMLENAEAPAFTDTVSGSKKELEAHILGFDDDVINFIEEASTAISILDTDVDDQTKVANLQTKVGENTKAIEELQIRFSKFEAKAEKWFSIGFFCMFFILLLLIGLGIHHYFKQ